jgi:predicted chitinase
MKKRNNTVNEAPVAAGLATLNKLKNAYQSFKYGSTLPKEIEAIKQARIATALKQAELDAAKRAAKQAEKLKKAEIAAAKSASKAASKEAGKATVGREAGKAAGEVPKGVLGKTKDVVTYPFRKPVKTALGGTALATGYEYLKDPKAPIGDLVGRGINTAGEVASDLLGRAVEKGTEFAGDVVRGYTGGKPGQDTAGTDSTDPKDKPQSALPQSDSDDADREETDSSGDWVRNPKSPRRDMPDTLMPYPPGSISYDDVRWSKTPSTLDRPPEILPPGEFKFREATGKPRRVPESFIAERVLTDKELAQHFPDPNVRRAIIAKAQQESGNKNVGEKSYANTTNKDIRSVFKGRVAKVSDADLSRIKKNPEEFYNLVYGNLGGYKYRGRGPIQITGKKNYADIDRDLGLKGALVKDPDMLLRDPALARAASIQYLKNSGLHKITAKDQTDAAQRVIYSIGGPNYAPGSKSNNRVLAKITPYLNEPVKVAQNTTNVPPKVKVPPATEPRKPDVKTSTTTVTPSDKTGEPKKTVVPPVAAATDKPTDSIAADTRAEPRTEPTKQASIGSIDMEKLEKARASGEDLYDFSKFMIKPGKPASVSEAKLLNRYHRFLMQEDNQPVDLDSASRKYYDSREKKYGKTASDLMTTSGGQFMTRADRLNQDKVDAVLGAGKYKAGSAEANVALTKHFRQQADAAGSSPQSRKDSDTDKGKAALPGVRPAPAAAANVPQNLTPYSGAADVAGLTTLGTAGASLTGKFAPKLATLAGKALPGVNIAYQGADALRRASLGDTTGSVIAGASAIPALAIPGTVAQAVRDKYRTGAFFPSDEELKAAIDKEKGSATPPLKERKNVMNKKQQLHQKIKKLEEDRAHLQERLGAAARAFKSLPASKFGQMLRGLGADLSAPASTVRKGGQTFDKVRGVDSELKYANRVNPKDIKSLDDIKNIGDRKPAVWRRGEAPPAGAVTSPAAVKAAAELSAKTGKPLSKTLSTLLGAAGGGLIGYGLASGDKDQAPLPAPEPTPPGPEPTPRPRPRPQPSRPDSDGSDSAAYDTDFGPSTDSSQTTPDTYFPNPQRDTTSQSTNSDVRSGDSGVADYETLLRRQQEKDRSVPQNVVDLVTKGKQNNLSYTPDEEATRARDALKQSLGYQQQMKDIQNESLDRMRFLAGLKK